jgi:hypothetical protein
LLKTIRVVPAVNKSSKREFTLLPIVRVESKQVFKAFKPISEKRRRDTLQNNV